MYCGCENRQCYFWQFLLFMSIYVIWALDYVELDQNVMFHAVLYEFIISNQWAALHVLSNLALWGTKDNIIK